MNDNSFIDTNILLYCYTDDESDKNKKALNISDLTNVFISIQVLAEFSNVLRKKYKYPWNEIELLLYEIISDFNLFVTKSTTIVLACSIADIYKYSFYDSCIIAAALDSNCSILYSEDMHHGQIIENKLTIINPFL